MIQCEFTFLENDIVLQIEGHADFNKGNDIVCAGVSAIAYNLAGYLQVNETPFTFKDNPGDFICGIKKKDVGILEYNELESYYRFVLVGLMQIAKTYPKNVTVKINK